MGFKGIFGYFSKHKIVSAIALIVFIYAGYRVTVALTTKTGETRYMLGTVTKGSVIATVTGSGQVSVVNQIDLKPKASGDLTYIGVAPGQQVKAGTLVASLDARDALKAVRDAQTALETAKLTLQKIQQPPDALSVTQSENALARAKESEQNAKDDLVKAHEDGFNDVSNAFLDLPSVMTGIHDLLYTNNAALGGGTQWNIDYYADTAATYDAKAVQFKLDTDTKYQAARTAYDKSFLDYKGVSRFSDDTAVESIITETYDTTKSIAEAVKSANNLIQFYKDRVAEHGITPAPLADTHLASLNTFTGKTNSHLSTLLGATTTIANDRSSILNAERTITENTQSLAKLNAGADSLDLRSAQIAVADRQNALIDAQIALSNYSVRAPFDGVISKVSAKKFDSIGSGTVVATLVTQQKIATLSLNEVDVAKIKLGQKTTLTFDAVDGLSITGEVSEIDTVGTVSQGVVTYSVTIGFDTQDDRVKSGMSVSAAIITDMRQDVLTVPASAVKSQGGVTYVEALSASVSAEEATAGVVMTTPPPRKPVEVGLSSDTTTEITSGLNEGDQIVVRTVTTAAPKTTAAPSIIGGGGVRVPGGGGGFRSGN